MANIINRRKFFTDTAISAAGIIIGSNLTGCTSSGKPSLKNYNVVDDMKKFRKIDTHIHVNLFGGSQAENLIAMADRMHIEKMILSRPVVQGEATPEEIRKCNDMVLNAVRLYPDRFIGQLTINPAYQKESFEEIKRCIDQGMVGLKVYHQVKISDPLFYPVIEKFIDLRMIILMHANCQLGVGGYRMKYDKKMPPNTSIPEDFVIAAKRYPEAMFQFAHIAGGGDWEYECKMLRDYPNIYVDTSGSNNEENLIAFAVRQLGEDRLFFGTDNSFYQSVGKILASGLTESQKRKIFFENYNNVLRKGGYHVV
jgi:predicted TIM-barrel fold metal-dependent hydrolase